MKKLFILLLLVSHGLFAQQVDMLCWNIESGGAQVEAITERLSKDFTSVDILALSEVSLKDFPEIKSAFAKAINAKVGAHITEIGFDDRLAVFYNKERFKMEDYQEIEGLSLQNPGLRPAQVLKLKDLESGKMFYVVNNHLSRGRAGEEWKRYAQAYMLQNWARSLEDEIIFLVGDFNFDYETRDPEASRSEAFDILRLDRYGNVHLHWVKPDKIIPTQCTWDERRNTCRYHSVLDFVFCNEKALSLNPKSWIIEKDGEFPDGDVRPDHRPVLCTFNW